MELDLGFGIYKVFKLNYTYEYLFKLHSLFFLIYIILIFIFAGYMVPLLFVTTPFIFLSYT